MYVDDEDYEFAADLMRTFRAQLGDLTVTQVAEIWKKHSEDFDAQWLSHRLYSEERIREIFLHG